jgi:hypothetical protein
MKEPIADYASSSGPSRPRGRRRILWIILLTVLPVFLVWEFVLESHVVVVGQGYLNGYGYHLRSLVRLHSLWNTVESRTVILWRAEKPPVFGKYFEVDGHALIAGPSQKRAANRVYSLQPDYTLKETPLSPKEVNRVLDLMDRAIKSNNLTPDDLWRTRVEPDLRLVGTRQEGHAATTDPAVAPTGTD